MTKIAEEKTRKSIKNNKPKREKNLPDFVTYYNNDPRNELSRWAAQK